MKHIPILRAAVVVIAAGSLLGACRTHYVPSNISRTRLLVDHRYDGSPDANDAVAYLQPLRARVDSMMNPVVGRTARYLERGRPEGLLSNLLPDILMWASDRYGEHPDFAVYNYGGIRAALPAGDVTIGDLLEVAPFENKICFGTLSGTAVLELFRQFPLRGVHGVSHGVQLVYDKQHQLVSAAINGKLVDAQDSYRFVTIDYLADGNDGLTAFTQKTDFVAPSGPENNSRELIADYFRHQTAQGIVVDAKKEGRITIKP